jgi:hypothetical protein
VMFFCLSPSNFMKDRCCHKFVYFLSVEILSITHEFLLLPETFFVWRITCDVCTKFVWNQQGKSSLFYTEHEHRTAIWVFSSFGQCESNISYWVYFYKPSTFLLLLD